MEPVQGWSLNARVLISDRRCDPFVLPTFGAAEAGLILRQGSMGGVFCPFVDQGKQSRGRGSHRIAAFALAIS
jgi:hypothetical protein